MGLWQRVLDRFAPSAPEDPDLAAALERAAAQVEPRLKQSRGWPRRFVRPITGALAQARRVAACIPGPVTVDEQHFVRDPFVHALFGSGKDILQLLRDSRVVQNYVKTSLRSEAYALLSMRRQERHALGIALDGEVLRREVPQTQVWFSDHRLLGPTATETEAREQLFWTLFDRFLERIAVGVEHLRTERDRLTQEKDLALARLRGAPARRRAELQRALDEVLGPLTETTQSLELERLHEVFESVLSHPEDCLYQREYRLTLDRMGTMRETVGGGAAEIRFTELLERYQEPRTVVLVHFPALPAADTSARLSEAMRLLG